MKRRNFIKGTATGSAFFAFAGLTNCRQQTKEDDLKSQEKVKPFELDELSVSDLTGKMETGELSALKITKIYLSRINEIDKKGPALNSVIEINPDALKIADKLDKERQNKKIYGPLHGIPVLIKDNIDTADKMMTTAGSLALVGSIAKQDSQVAKKLREAGAIILGKTNLSEWANFRSLHSSSGWSGRGGQTLNPYALDRNPCGSSSGSGVAVSANLCALAIGTETNGSVVCPATVNGIVGIKPTVGLIGRSGIIPISHTQDTAGPMARTVKDAALLLGALTGIDKNDVITKNSKDKNHQDYTKFLDINGLKGARIGIARNYFGFHPDVDRLMEKAISKMSELGAIIVDPANIKTKGEYGDSSFDVLLYEFKDDLNKYLKNVDKKLPVHSLKELIEFNKQHKEEEMPFFEQEIFEMSQEKGGLESLEYKKALKKVLRLSQKDGIDATINENDLDAIIAPTGGPAWKTDHINGDHFLGSSSSPAARSGYPNITVPAGYLHGVPVGISFFSGAYKEPELLKFAFAYEQATKHRIRPKFLPQLPV